MGLYLSLAEMLTVSLYFILGMLTSRLAESPVGSGREEKFNKVVPKVFLQILKMPGIWEQFLRSGNIFSMQNNRHNWS